MKLDVIIQNRTAKGTNYAATAENLEVDNIEDLSFNIAWFVRRTILHYDFLSEKGVKGINHLKIKSGGITEITLILKSKKDLQKVSFNFKDFGKFARNCEEADIANVLHETIKYQQEVVSIFQRVSIAQANELIETSKN